MRVCCEIRRVLSKNPNTIKDDQFKVEFTNSSQPVDEQATAAKIAKETMWSKMRWYGIAGILGSSKQPEETKVP